MLLALSLRPQASSARRALQNVAHQCLRRASYGRPTYFRPRNAKEVGSKERVNDSQEAAQRGHNFKLLEELFPEEGQRLREPQREVPRLPFDDPTPVPSVEKTNPMSIRSRQAFEKMEKEPSQVTVLVFRNASKNLADEDFRRLIPKGKHIEGWHLEAGDILRVIPGRDILTLERLNYYYLLFRTPISAFTYQGRVTRIANLARMYTPSSLTSPMPIAPGGAYLPDGEDVHELLQSYTLTPPSQKPSMRQLAPPLTPLMRAIVHFQGYPEIVDRPEKSPAEVLLRFEGPQLAAHQIKIAINRAEVDRALHWTGTDYNSVKITLWEPPHDNISPMQQVRGRGIFRRATGKADDEEESMTEAEREEEERQQMRNLRKPPKTYILGFDNEAQASTFVRYWHRRLMHVPDLEYADGDTAAIVNAEILW